MKKIIVLVTGVVFFWSCNNSSDKSTHKETENQAIHHQKSSEAVELNNGKKWVVNDEMKPFVLKGEELANTYIQNGQSDYKTLAEQLKKQNSQLIKSCTMDGKSHNELHKWLHPHLQAVEDLEKVTDAASANKIVLKLQHSYEQYHQYFN
ncbi:MAG: hypothetical protein JST70_11225 [Bacteroidetes bacterium]|nr:hypothetical protein [Bacteroidota bacterium]